MTEPQWIEISKGVADIVQVGAILVGGSWAYFKFARGRTFADRLELVVSGALIRSGDATALLVTCSLRNEGASRVCLRDYARSAYVYGLPTSRWRQREPADWEHHLRIEEVFVDHEWIEAQEIITDRLLIPVDSGSMEDRLLAVRVKAVVASSGRKAHMWTAVAIVPDGFAPLDGVASRAPTAGTPCDREE